MSQNGAGSSFAVATVRVAQFNLWRWPFFQT
jgi:hypothetical protein